MRPTLIIAGNFLRQVRWLLILYPVTAMGFGVLLNFTSRQLSREDLDVYFWQQVFYSVGIAIFLAGQVSYNERKSRRILAVLSKGIERRDYLGGLLLGVFITSGLCVAGALAGTLSMAWQHSLPVPAIFAAMLLLWLSCCLGAAIAMLLSTFLHPLLAVAGTFLVAGLGSAKQVGILRLLIPVFQLNVEGRWLLTADPAELLFPAATAAVEIFIFWLLAGWIFERRDIAVAIE